MMLKLVIIARSTRLNRAGESIGTWVHHIASFDGDVFGNARVQPQHLRALQRIRKNLA